MYGNNARVEKLSNFEEPQWRRVLIGQEQLGVVEIGMVALREVVCRVIEGCKGKAIMFSKFICFVTLCAGRW